jgi:hypothetical protein
MTNGVECVGRRQSLLGRKTQCTNVPLLFLEKIENIVPADTPILQNHQIMKVQG